MTLAPTPAALPWLLGWVSIGIGFLGGAALGIGFLRDDSLGGYGSPRRRLLRLAHIAAIALGLLNLILALSIPASAGTAEHIAVLGLGCGAIAMPIVCLLCAWRPRLRVLFPVPVSSLLAGVAAVLWSAL